MTARTKFIAAVFVIVTAIFISISLSNQNKFGFKFGGNNQNVPEPQAEFKLVTAATNVKIGEPFKFSLFFKNRDTSVVSFDSVVAYDSSLVRIDDIKTSNIFPQYTRKLIEDYKNRFILSGVQTNLKSNLQVSEGELAEVTVTPLKAGKAVFDFVVEGTKYTNLIGNDLRNIPFSVNKLEVNVTE